jgi:hypothetical protein
MAHEEGWSGLVGCGGSRSSSFCSHAAVCAASAPSRSEAPVTRGFRNPRSSHVAASSPNHRARDRIVAVGGAPVDRREARLRNARFAISSARRWRSLRGPRAPASFRCWASRSPRTTGEHAEVDGAHDSGGRVYFRVPEGKTLGLGRPRGAPACARRRDGGLARRARRAARDEARRERRRRDAHHRRGDRGRRVLAGRHVARARRRGARVGPARRARDTCPST